MGQISVSRAEPTDVGKTLKEMVVGDVEDEEKAIETYKESITLGQKKATLKEHSCS